MVTAHAIIPVSFPLVLTLKRIIPGCLIWTVISWCKTYYCIGSTQQAGQPPSERGPSRQRRGLCLRSVNDSCFSPSGLEPAGIKTSKDTKSLSQTRPAPRIVRMWGVVMEVGVYQQTELLTYYRVCLMWPCRSQRKQAVMQMDLLRKSSGLSSRRGERWRQRETAKERDVLE